MRCRFRRVPFEFAAAVRAAPLPFAARRRPRACVHRSCGRPSGPRCAGQGNRARGRAAPSRSKVARIPCLSAIFKSMKLATMSASRGMDSMLRMALTSSPGACGSSCTASSALSRSLSPRASVSGSSAVGLLVDLDSRHQEGLAADVIQHREALFALRDQMMRAVRRGDEAHDGGGRADPVQRRQGQSRPRRFGRRRQPVRSAATGPRGAGCARLLEPRPAPPRR